ncbi:hypothetical protein [Streptomyces sp. IB201691-2A2]|uniref:hypothetical protein n=1 Tax=Streptomyces sp. IB201691-2A2 TaxID=2561920 RepID=UPI00117D1EAD|nr:hypothetical protein [Streptomyces sp. IB201691-2A2]TRO69760.1 hypothetical protein E4K73_03895 [Streptomyces sp. IB201691-2A2]
MLRGLVHGLAWSLATGAAVTLSWWGVHTVMAGTAYDPPLALPITADGATEQGAKPLASSTSRPESGPEPSKSRSSSAGRSPSAPASSSPPSSPSPSKSAGAGGADHGAGASGVVKSYDTDGGRVVFDLGKSYASLVSATPASGWSMQVWKTETWIRVEFSAGADRVSVFCTWHDSAPRVSVNDY